MPERNLSLSATVALVCLLAGRHCLMPELTIRLMWYWLGEAMEGSLLGVAVLADSQKSQRVCPSALTGRAAVVLCGKGIICALLVLWKSTWSDFPGEFAGAVLMTVGTAGLVCEFVRTLKTQSNVTASGFAAGLMIALVTASLFG